MTPEAQRIAIAEAVGWKNCRAGNFDDVWADSDDPTRRVEVPDYLNDLNACHEFEKTFGPWECPMNKDETLYHDHLIDVCLRDNQRYVVHATAAQRCEAFLKTKGLWK